MKHFGLACAAFIFLAPAVSAQTAGQSVPPAPTYSATPQPSPELPPPFVPPPRAKLYDNRRTSAHHHSTTPSHKTEHHGARKKHHEAAKRQRSSHEQHKSLHLSKRTIRECHKMTYKQIMAHKYCRALMSRDLDAAEKQHRSARHNHAAKHHGGAAHHKSRKHKH